MQATGNRIDPWVNSGGVFTPALSAFNIPIEVPYTGVASLAGNVSYDTVNILPGTLPSGSILNLNAFGTNTTNLIYVFPGNFTVATGATLTVGPTVSVVVGGGDTLADSGNLNFSSGDTVTLNDGAGQRSASAIVVAGTMTTNGTTFNVNASNEGTGSISVNSGGVLNASVTSVPASPNSGEWQHRHHSG